MRRTVNEKSKNQETNYKKPSREKNEKKLMSNIGMKKTETETKSKAVTQLGR